MNAIGYAACAVAVIGALLAITRRNAIHALLSLIAMLLAVAVIFFVLGAPFISVLQVAIYAGAIMVLFVFVVMMLNLGPPQEREEQRWLGGGIWAVPAVLAAAFLALGYYAVTAVKGAPPSAGMVGPKQVGLALYRDYVLVVELASLLLVAGLVGAFHIAPPTREEPPVEPSHAPAPHTQAEEATYVSGR